MEILFLGATGTVTGSRYLATLGTRRILVDCGLFQGVKSLRLRNREPFPVDPAEIDAVVLTHAHIDHSGYLPALVRDGFRGPIHCTEATRTLCELLLPDSARIQEEEAEYANRHGYSKHRPALPLYTSEDAAAALERLTPVGFGVDIDLGGGVTARWSHAGHILGAASIRLAYGGRSILFSGDVGRPDDPILLPPSPPADADYLVVESTYGDRVHERADPRGVLGDVVRRTAARGGVVVIPAFAVGRTQTILYHLAALRAAGAIPEIPIYLDSPMAIDATRILHRHIGEHRLTTAQCVALYSSVRMANTVEESKAVMRAIGPRIIISASGMATGGRVLHHLKAFAPDPRSTVLFVGHQAAGTRGAAALAGAASLKIHGEYVPLRAEVVSIGHLSAHADREELLAWMSGMRTPPREAFVTHGEPVASDALRQAIEERLGWRCTVPDYLQGFRLGAGGAEPLPRRVPVAAG
jgi:metallo-beta-lactamase family protein